MDQKPILPIIHLNGDSKEALMSQRCDALLAIQEAMDSLRGMAPNGRNYYPVDGLMEKAQAQQRRRAAVLQALYDEIEAEALSLDGL